MGAYRIPSETGLLIPSDNGIIGKSNVLLEDHLCEIGLVITIVVLERLRVYCDPTENQTGDPCQMESAMRRFITNALVTGIVCAGMAASMGVRPIAAADSKDDPSVLQADHALVAALGKADKSAAEKFLDADFMWTNSAGETLSKAKVLSSSAQAPSRRRERHCR